MTVDNTPTLTHESIESWLNLIGGKGKIDLWEMARRITQTEHIQSLCIVNSYVKQETSVGFGLVALHTPEILANFSPRHLLGFYADRFSIN
jgi:hypothetical protein